MRRVNPLPELIFGHLSDRAESVPSFREVCKVCLACFIHGVETVHHLMLIKLSCLRVYLVNDKDIALSRIVREIYIDMVSVYALCAADVSVVIVESVLPLVALRVGSSTDRSFRVLDGDVVSIETKVAHLVVAGLLLRFGRIGVDVES